MAEKTLNWTAAGLRPGDEITLSGANEASAVVDANGVVAFTTTADGTHSPSVTEPSAPPPPFSSSVRAGNWSDPGTWDFPPAADRDVVVLHAVTCDAGACRRCDVLPGGDLTLAGLLDAHGSVVAAGGTIRGSEFDLAFHVPDDRLFVGNTTPGPNPNDPDDHSDTDVGLWGMEGGSVLLRGPVVTPWLDALPEADPGTPLPYGGREIPSCREGVAVLAAEPVGWRPGDRLLIASVRGTHCLATLMSSVGASVFYSADDSDFVATSIEAGGRRVNSKVANLSRRAVVRSALVAEGDPNHRAHCVFGHHVHTHLDYVEFRDLGPRAKLGRYPVHFHHAGHLEHEGGIVGCSVWQSTTDLGNRTVTVHASQHVKVHNNVLFKSRGHSLFFEDGTEVLNSVVGNLSVDVSGGEELPVVDNGAAPGAHHYWLRAGNRVEGNVAVGGQFGAAVGLVLLPERSGEVSAPLAEAAGQQCLGVGKYGFWPRNVPAKLTGLVATFCGAGVGDGLGPHDLTLDDPTLLYNGTTATVYPAGVYMNQNGTTVVNGGVVAGEHGIHIHYGARLFRSVGTAWHCKYLVDPTYWSFCCLFEGGSVQVTMALFKGGYPIKGHEPALVRFANVAAGPLGPTWSADYTAAGSISLPGFEGVPDSGGRRLDTLQGPTGYAKPPAGAQSTWKWSVTPAGQAERPFWDAIHLIHPAFNQLARWQGSLDPYLGFPRGLPPGTYRVVFKKPDATLVTYPSVIVSPGVVTDLATLTPS